MSVGFGEGGVEPIAHAKDSWTTVMRRAGVSIGEAAVLAVTMSAAVGVAWGFTLVVAIVMR